MYKVIIYKYNIIYFIFRMKLVQSLCLINSSGLFTGLLQFRGESVLFLSAVLPILQS